MVVRSARGRFSRTSVRTPAGSVRRTDLSRTTAAAPCGTATVILKSTPHLSGQRANRRSAPWVAATDWTLAAVTLIVEGPGDGVGVGAGVGVADGPGVGVAVGAGLGEGDGDGPAPVKAAPT